MSFFTFRFSSCLLLLLISTFSSALTLHAFEDRDIQSRTRPQVRRYTFNVSRQAYAPDGVQKQGLLVNGQFPGPALEANYGDTFQVTVHNNLDEGTALHWHGLFQKGTMWYDGAPATDNCPIPPGASFTYTFKADQPGTSWWHSHYDAQIADGLLGPMIIRGSRYGIRYDVELPPVLIGAHYHKTYKQVIEDTVSVPQTLPFIDSNLINGKGTYNCSAVTIDQACSTSQPLSSFNFETKKAHLIRLVNVGAEGMQHFSIDGHQMVIVANDFTPVQPYKSDFITLAPGQRTDIIVQGLSDSTGAYFMRAKMSQACDPVINPNVSATVYYPRANRNKQPTSNAAPYDVNVCTNDDLSKTVPLQSRTPPRQPAVTQEIDITLGVNGSGVVQFFMNGSPFSPDYNNPVLLLANNGTTNFDPQSNVYNMGTNSSVRLVINNKTPLAHPMHLHGHDPWVLASGTGSWDGTVTNPKNPQRRDVQVVPANGYIVFEYIQDNPGVWAMHCHIVWHAAVGMYINLLERPADVKRFTVPDNVVQNCRAWRDWTGRSVIN